MKKLITICILATVAFLNATYLTTQNYKIEQATDKWQISSFCDLSSTLSCTNVLASPYSKIFWMPFTAIAMAVYPLIFLIAFLGIYWIIKKPFSILIFMWAWWILFNSYFIYQEYANIWAYCPLCILCSAIIITISILSWIWVRESKKLKN